MLKITEADNLRDIYNFQLSFEVSYFFTTDFESWKKSFTEDIDGEGRQLFNELTAKAVYNNDELVGFIQYGKTAFGFADNGEISSDISYPVIRSFYFKKDEADAGKLLLSDALENLGNNKRVYAFFHYFGMTCFARHGKLFEKYDYIEALLKENSFVIEHENVYYSSTLNAEENSEVVVTPHDMTKGNHQYIDFHLNDSHVGGCEVHYLDENTAYLRWIYVNSEITGKGIGTKCMKALKSFLYEKGFTRFDTDTAVNNTVAQHYYEKTGFKREGITKSFFN
jgi:ribosomal protein S18 acetylase RimI-like enzyme